MDYKDFDWERIKWKPLWTRTNGQRTVLRDRFGFAIDEHPVVIMECGSDVLFLKSQTAKWSNFKKDELKGSYANDLWTERNGVIVKRTEAFNPGLDPKNSLFSGDSLIDTTQVFVMDKKEFLECVDFNENSLYITRSVNIDDRVTILEALVKNINSQQVSITQIQLEKGKEPWQTKTVAKLLYCENDVLKHDLLYLKDVSEKQEEYANKFVKEFDNSNNQEYLNTLGQIVREELKRCELTRDLYYDEWDLDKYLSLDNKLAKFGYRLNYTNDELSDIQDEDIASLKERASFSDFERDYYKMHPDLEQKLYPVKYYDFLETYEELEFCKENNEEFPELDEDIYKKDNLYYYER